MNARAYSFKAVLADDVFYLTSLLKSTLERENDWKLIGRDNEDPGRPEVATVLPLIGTCFTLQI